MISQGYFFKRTKGDLPSYLVFDHSSKLHIPLTQFAHFAGAFFSKNTVTTYLYGLIKYFAWLEQESSLASESNPWNRSNETVRESIMAYLAYCLKCQVRMHNEGYYLVFATQGTNKTFTKTFLSAIKQFYQLMIDKKEYNQDNPLIQFKVSIRENKNDPLASLPIMPFISGVREHNSRKRLSSCYFVLANERWEPQIIDNADFPALILEAGALVGWKKREVVITRMLFETGARISEICGLTLGDWYRRGLNQEASAFNKGSYNQRVKFLRWSNNTTKLLIQYFNEDRCRIDSSKLSLKRYLHYTPEQLDEVPLFLTKRGKSITPKLYRDLYWNRACARAKIDANIHQTRHWYVTAAIRQIYGLKQDSASQDRRVQELIQYMGWRSGKNTLEAYKHYFNQQSYAEIHDQLHRKLNSQLQAKLKKGSPSSNIIPILQRKLSSDKIDEDWEYLYQLGGKDK